MQTTEQPVTGIGHNSRSVADVLRDNHLALIKRIDANIERKRKLETELGDDGAIANDEQLEVAISIGVEAKNLEAELGRTKLDTTKPLRDEVTETNRFFDALAQSPANVKTQVGRLTNDWRRKKQEAEAKEAAEAHRRAQEEAERQLAEAAEAQGSVASDVALNAAIDAENCARAMEMKATAAPAAPVRTAAGTMFSSKEWIFAVEDWSKIDLRELRNSFSVAEIEKAIRAHVRKNKNTVPLSGVRIYQSERPNFRG